MAVKFTQTIFMASVLLGAATIAAEACEGQAGASVFEDDFSDDSGGWLMSPNYIVWKPKEMDITLDAKNAGETSLVGGFNANDGDYCVEGIIPKPQDAAASISLAVVFWAADYSNYYDAQLGSDGKLSLYRRLNGNWASVVTDVPAPSYKADADAVNALRVLAKNNKISIFVNGASVKVVRAQTPQGQLRFGAGAYLGGKVIDGIPAVKIKSYKATAGE
jgi:hypothetical protein